MIEFCRCVFSLQFPPFFGFVINDIVDAELDRKAGKLRNPVASGDLSVAAAWALVLVLLAGRLHPSISSVF